MNSAPRSFMMTAMTAAGASLIASAPAFPAEKSQPNIVFILVDDLGWRDVGAYGSTFYDTPNADRLAASGMMFTDGYAACPVCSPSRAAILSGKYPARMDTTDWFGGHRKGMLLPAPDERAQWQARFDALLEKLPVTILVNSSGGEGLLS